MSTQLITNKINQKIISLNERTAKATEQLGVTLERFVHVLIQSKKGAA